MTDTPPLAGLDDEVLMHELQHLYEKRLDTLRHGSEDAVEASTRRISDLEGEYLRRRPGREVDPNRLRSGARARAGVEQP